MYYEIVGDSRDRPAWLRQRQKTLGASELPGILGLSRYETPLSVYESKVRVADPADEEQSRQAWIGRELEPEILRLVAHDLGAVSFQHCHALLRSTRYPWLSCTMDGKLLFPDDWNWCEIKIQADRDMWTNGVPDDCFAQCQQQMIVTGADQIRVGLFFVGFAADIGHAIVERDDEFIEEVALPASRKFWDEHVLPEREKGLEIDGAEATTAALNRLHAIETVETQTSVIGEEWLEYADEIVALNEQINMADARKRYLQNLVRSQMGDYSELVLSDGRYFTWTTQKGGEYTRKDSRVLRGPYGGVK